ncbi:late competence development ComFB family protein [uncultured Treponema sp.]|uniref:late competence development ComFB family protein n=1 Tax=uncultured Treponema sp. TaxID=162155 RepID=UPI0015C00100|nr:late competence development ComFB family protein [uncultured Treponema sp.]
MNIHNLMEEVVTHRINSLYNQVKEVNASWLTCDCENCRADAISYVLNRVAPRYVVSGRGVTHAHDILKNPQIKADIDALGLEAIRIISSTKRPFHSSSRAECVVEVPENPVFNFPIIQGCILEGNTFEPLADATVKLSLDGKEVPMADVTWANPINTYNSTKGTYSFWPKALQVEKPDQTRKFNFSIEVTHPGYDPVNYSFDTNLVSENKIRKELDTTLTLKIMDLVMFREDIKNTMDRMIKE